MQPKGLEFKTRLRQASTFVIMLIVLLSLLANARPGTASADSVSGIGMPSDTLTIKVGYFGGPYYTKKVYTVSDLEAMPQVQQAYTFIDNMPSVCIDSAKGVKLTGLLGDAGIDANSVEVFYFYATDVKKGWYECLPKSFLLDTTRYYYPNLPAHWDSNTQSSIPGAVYEAIRVDPVIAIQDNWQRFVISPDFTRMTGDNRFRLVFGQNDTSAHTASRSVKWVHAIEVMLGGTPPSGVTLDQDMVKLKVGSTVQLTATVGPEEATDKSVTWSSSNPGVATVGNNGLVMVVDPGTAVITVSTVVGNLTAACVVNNPSQGGGQSVGSAGSSNNGAPGNPTEPSAPEANRHYLAEKDAATVVVKSPGVPLQEAGSQPWRVFEMSADAVPLQMQKEQNSLDVYAVVIFLILFLLGSGRRYMEYTREVAR